MATKMAFASDTHIFNDSHLSCLDTPAFTVFENDFDICNNDKSNIIKYNIVAAFRRVHVSPAKHGYA